MPVRRPRFSPQIIGLFLLMGGFAISLYQWQDSRVFKADEVRVYRLKNYDTPDSRMLVHLQGNEAQNAVRHFIVEPSAFCSGCLNPRANSFVRIEFLRAGKPERECSVSIATGQIYPYSSKGCLDNVTENSRRYWANMVRNSKNPL